MNGFTPLMLLREIRASWRRLLLLVLCVAAGVGGMVAVKAFSQNLSQAVRGEARTLMAGDLVMRSRRPPSPAEEQALASLRSRGAEVVRSFQFVTMARSGERRGSGATLPGVQLVSARAVGSGYPFYGQVETASGKPFRSLLDDGTVLVHESLLLKMGLRVGDSLRIGRREFRIADVLTREPDSPVQVFNLGPRVLMTETAGQATGLITAVSRIRYTALVRLPPGMDPAEVAEGLRKKLPDSFASFDTFDRAQPQVTRFLSRLTAFLNLVGLAVLLLGGIGVAGAVRVFVAQKLDTLAILKCLGATPGRLLGIYLMLALLLGIGGSLLGVALGYTAHLALPWLLADLLPVDLKPAWPWRAAGEGMLLGSLTTLWFALPPLLSMRKVRPARVFRRHVEAPPAGARRFLGPLVSGGALLAGAALLVVWQAGFTREGGIFLLALSGSVAALHLAAVGLLGLLRWLPKPRTFELKQGLSSLYRPGNQSGTVVMSLGLGVLVLLAVFLIQRDLVRQITTNAPHSQPNLFFIDIQPRQKEEMLALMGGYGFADPVMIPIVRGRVAGISGRPIRPGDIRDGHRRRHATSEFAMTYRAAPVEGERVIAGTFAGTVGGDGNRPSPEKGSESEKAREPRVSVADWFAQDAGVRVGETLTFDIQGIPITARVTSIRKIDWANRRANFSFVFLPGALEDAPHVFATAVRVDDGKERAALQRDVVTRLPNVTALDVEMVYVIVQNFMDRIATVVRFMAAFCIAVGLVILLGAIATTKFQRIREAVLLKILGATRGKVARVLALEYLLLGALAGAVGAGAAGGLSWGLVTQVFGGVWDLSLPPYLVAWIGTALLIAFTGMAGSLDILVRKPLDVLREE